MMTRASFKPLELVRCPDGHVAMIATASVGLAAAWCEVLQPWILPSGDVVPVRRYVYAGRLTHPQLDVTYMVGSTAPCVTCAGQGQRLPRSACLWLLAEDGAVNPGGCVCVQHGLSIVSEIEAKRGERWCLVPLTRGADPWAGLSAMIEREVKQQE
jgi:hypothetical protein